MITGFPLQSVLHRIFSSKAHRGGSDQNNLIADMIEEKWRGFGFITKRSVYDTLLSLPSAGPDQNRVLIVLTTTKQ